MKIIRNFFTVGTSILGSRILGFIRETLMASTLGIGAVTDAFVIAFSLPFLFRRLVAEGAFHNSFVPLFSHEKELNGTEGAQRLSSEIWSVLLTIVVVLTIVVELSLPLLIHFVIAPGFSYQSPEYYLTIQLSQIIFPSIIFIALTALITGALYALGHYFVASITPVFLNIPSIIVLTYALLNNSKPQDTVYFISCGMTLASIIQLWATYYYIRRSGIKIRFQYPRLTDNVRKFLKLTFPLIFTGTIIQINSIIGRALATKEFGLASALQYADRTYQLPIAIIGVAMGLVVLPELSRALKSKDKSTTFTLQNQAIECVLFLSIPAFIILYILSKEIIQTLYERGAFTHENTIFVSSIISIYSIGIIAFILSKTLQTIFYARKNMKTPMHFTLISIAVSCVISIVSFPFIGGYGIACAEVASGWVNAILLTVTLLRRKQLFLPMETIYRILSIFISSGLMGAFIILSKPYFFSNIAIEQTFVSQFTSLFAILSCAVLVYLSSIALFIGKKYVSSFKKMMKK
ncbi:integral membrane protein MviN [Candidatus Liberibacter solanacearum CLso-ZC1]|uniref:Probable lipid II flippase MurJ n=1 Tax=Liberibacter solanacearum (strain CLso-ZC1) TaxID=658172 RepID=E4UCC6_LIBSC|nr:murein biosynthesis integral membrane protein MurJ [Candidatus Liberibacter solanacearum]ADR52016.1 integral membrane protein MviN [Candidatus Liberibacter solanacearum CLso-ZC1]